MKVTYCEWLFLGSPKEIEMSYEDAKKRYDDITKHLEKFNEMVRLGSFVGIKDKKGKWLKRYSKEQKLEEVL